MNSTTLTQPPLSLDQIIRIEPSVAGVLERAKAERLCCGWYGPAGLKSSICMLVGWGARNPRLASSESYEAVYFAALRSLRQDKCPRCDARDREEGWK